MCPKIYPLTASVPKKLLIWSLSFLLETKVFWSLTNISAYIYLAGYFFPVIQAKFGRMISWLKIVPPSPPTTHPCKSLGKPRLMWWRHRNHCVWWKSTAPGNRNHFLQLDDLPAVTNLYSFTRISITCMKEVRCVRCNYEDSLTLTEFTFITFFLLLHKICYSSAYLNKFMRV